MKNKNFTLFFCASLFLGGCTNQYVTEPIKKEPFWILNPQIEGKISGSGCAKMHYKGVNAQKELAISRAIDQIALQKKVKVNNINYRTKTYKNNALSSFVNNSSLQEIEDIKLSTKIKSIYIKDNGDICAWVVEN